uniref:DUF5731 domain-containing protein n=1 Tax=Macrostomum lignano TaxID=282301 RepID=A0A1I8FGZ7_9PLAT
TWRRGSVAGGFEVLILKLAASPRALSERRFLPASMRPRKQGVMRLAASGERAGARSAAAAACLWLRCCGRQEVPTVPSLHSGCSRRRRGATAPSAPVPTWSVAVSGAAKWPRPWASGTESSPSPAAGVPLATTAREVGATRHVVRWIGASGVRDSEMQLQFCSPVYPVGLPTCSRDQVTFQLRQIGWWLDLQAVLCRCPPRNATEAPSNSVHSFVYERQLADSRGVARQPDCGVRVRTQGGL